MRIGAAFRAVRKRRGWRQSDVAARAGVSQSFVSLVERGHLDLVSLARLRAIGRVLDVRIDINARWRGGSLDRMLSLRHSLLAVSVAARFERWPGWSLAPEVSFSIYGERGVIDLLAFHQPSRSLLVIELKTAVIDINETIGNLDREARLAPRIARERGWEPDQVSRWLIVSRSKTNLRRIDVHRSVLRAAFPDDGRLMQSWLLDPGRAVRALSTWSHTSRSGAGPSRPRRGGGLGGGDACALSVARSRPRLR
jgi:transcriptional regulator with XRE-family HTH domain